MISETPLRRSFAIQARVIGALLMREVITRYGRHNIGFWWLFVEPMLFTLGVTVVWSILGEEVTHGSKIPVVAFALTGYSSVLVWRNMPARLCVAIEPNLALMYHRNVKVIDIFISRLLLEAVGATISFVILSIIFILIGWIRPPEDLLTVIHGWFMLIWFGVSLGLLIGGWGGFTDVAEKLWSPTAYILFPLSGAAFMVDWLSPSFQKLALFLPMVHGVELLREGYFGSAVQAHYDLAYLSIICLCLNSIGLALVREASRRVIPE